MSYLNQREEATDLMREELDSRTSEFEQLLQKTASAIASGVQLEKLPPSKLLEKADIYITLLYEVAN
jgi:hypothetical protein